MTGHVVLDPNGARSVADVMDRAAASIRGAVAIGRSLAASADAASAVHSATTLASELEAEGDLLRQVAARAETADDASSYPAVFAWSDDGVESLWSDLVAYAAPKVAGEVAAAAEGVHVASRLLLQPWEAIGVAADRLGAHGAHEVDRPDLADPGGTFDARPLTSFPGFTNGRPTRRGRGALGWFVADTSADTQFLSGPARIADDEFELIRHNASTWTVILPGVVDLRKPVAGLDPAHRSVRDLDASAVGASLNPDPEADPYAQLVAQALAEVGVPDGADVLLVGHSYGAGAAVRLSASPAFTDRYDITQVLAVGYHADPWLGSVPASTDVLVLQNTRDLVIAAQAAAHGVAPFLDDGERQRQVVRFDGGFGSAGHHQRHYLDHVATTDDHVETAFMAEVARRGHADPGAAWAIDVSVPGPTP